MIKIDDEEIKYINEKLDNLKNKEKKDKYTISFFTSYR